MSGINLYLVIHLEGILRHLIQSTIVVCHNVHGLLEYCENFKGKIPIFFEHDLFSKVKWLYQVCPLNGHSFLFHFGKALDRLLQ